MPVRYSTRVRVSYSSYWWVVTVWGLEGKLISWGFSWEWLLLLYPARCQNGTFHLPVSAGSFCLGFCVMWDLKWESLVFCSAQFLFHKYNKLLNLLSFWLSLCFLKKKWWGYCESLRPSVLPVITLSLPKPQGRIQPNLLYDFLAW